VRNPGRRALGGLAEVILVRDTYRRLNLVRHLYGTNMCMELDYDMLSFFRRVEPQGSRLPALRDR